MSQSTVCSCAPGAEPECVTIDDAVLLDCGNSFGDCRPSEGKCRCWWVPQKGGRLRQLSKSEVLNRVRQAQPRTGRHLSAVPDRAPAPPRPAAIDLKLAETHGPIVAAKAAAFRTARTKEDFDRIRAAFAKPPAVPTAPPAAAKPDEPSATSAERVRNWRFDDAAVMARNIARIMLGRGANEAQICGYAAKELDLLEGKK